MVEQAVASIDTILVGRDGKGGAIERLERGQAETRAILEETTAKITDAVKGMSNLHHNDVSELDKKIRDNHEAIKDLTEDSKGANGKIDKHLDDHEAKRNDADYKRGARQWALVKAVLTVILSCGGTIALWKLFGI